MNQLQFFRSLGAPLQNTQWSWGARRDEDDAVFLKVWKDEFKTHDGCLFARLTFHSKWRDRSFQHGYRERLAHIEQVKSGSKCFLVTCEAVDINARQRRVKVFNHESIRLGGRIVSLSADGEEDDWIELLPSMPAPMQ
jgi:hypothetical protein